MAFAASPSLSALASSSSSTAAAPTPSSNPLHEPRPLHLSLKPVLPLPKPHALSCSAPHIPRAAAGDGSGVGNGGKDGGGGGGGEDEDDCDDADFGPLLGFHEVLHLAAARGVALPGDMLEAAKDAGIREVLLLRYFDLQVLEFQGICMEDSNVAVFSHSFDIDLQAAPWPLGVLIRAFSMLRNRMLADPSFLFKVSTEVDAIGQLLFSSGQKVAVRLLLTIAFWAQCRL
jgi:hypothetical protein